MSRGSLPPYVYTRPEWCETPVGDTVSHDSERPSFWTAPQPPQESGALHAHRTMEMDSGMYARPRYAGQPTQPMRSAGVHLHTVTSAAVSLSAHVDPALQARRVSDGAVRPLDRSSRWPSFHASSDVRSEPLTHAPRSEVMDAFRPPNQTWDEAIATAFASRTRVPAPQMHAWMPSEPTHILPPSNDTPNAEPTHVNPHTQNAEDDHDAQALVCEWIDEHGMCNMEIVGERVWMSHHLSRRHNVTGHERTQRACLWRGCAETMNKGSLARHVVSRHLRAGTSCGFCSKMYSRADVAKRHAKKCKVAHGVVKQEQDQIK